MTQLNPNQYKRLTAPLSYGSSDGLYWDSTNSLLVLVIGGTVRFKLSASQVTGAALMSDGTDIEAATTSGDVTIDANGATSIGAGKVLNAMLDARLAKYKLTSLTATQACALNSAPATLVAAPGVGFTTVVHQALLVLNFSGAAITGNGIVGLFETDSAGTALSGTLTLASFLGAGADVQKFIGPVIPSSTTGLTRADNKAIVLSQGTGDSTKGSSTSTVDIHLWYSTIPNGL